MRIEFEKRDDCKSSYHNDKKDTIIINDKLRSNKRLVLYEIMIEMFIMGYSSKKIPKMSAAKQEKCLADITKILVHGK